MHKLKASLAIIIIILIFTQMAVFATDSTVVLVQAPNLIIKNSTTLDSTHFSSETQAKIASSTYVVVIIETRTGTNASLQDEIALCSESPFQLNATKDNSPSPNEKCLPIVCTGVSYVSTHIWDTANNCEHGTGLINYQEAVGYECDSLAYTTSTTSDTYLTSYIYTKGEITNSTGLALTYQTMPAPSQYDGFVSIQIPTEGSTITNADSCIEVFSDQEYMALKITNTTDNDVIFETNSYVQPDLFNRQGPNTETGQYGYYVEFKKLPVLNNKSYVIEAYGCKLDNGKIVQSTEKAFRNFSFDNTHDIFVRINGITPDNLYENNVKFSVTRSLFYIGTPMYIQLNGHTIWAMGTGILTSEQYNIFNSQADYRQIGANTLSVVRQSDGEVFTSVNFYLKTPYNETTGSNEDSFSNNPTDGTVGGGTYNWSNGLDEKTSNAPQLPDNPNIIDYCVYAFKYIIYVLALIGTMMTSLGTGAKAAFEALASIFGFLPSPLPDMITAFCIVSLIAAFLKLVLRR